MSQETDLQTLREELKAIQSQTRRSRRRAAAVFAIPLLFVVISMVYAFAQRVAAVRNAEEALRQRMLAETSKIQADQNAEEAIRQRALAEASMMEARRQEARAAELAACCKKN